ncbi:uncharacterized protein LOC125258138 [Megalobrama amblycephala]|uniref:uncharacterized protein LOC125258138 n=1 Tax=Megalobrama amblycephala TaxID=75352 RepID=UPI00201480B6|nr:uncharacterized protein LOC125258138 [Megalobrama amblycephala]
MRCLSITLLFLATMLLAQVTCQLSGPSTCPCLKTSETVLRKENIRSYKIQKARVCQIVAIQFKTVRGLTFCSDPRKPWVKRAIEYVDKKKNANKTTARPKNSKSTTTELNTTSHWNRRDELGASSPEFINKGSGFSYCPCLKMSETVLHKDKIESYKIYEAGVCHIDAIEFKTVNGLSFCYDPQNLWVKRAMQFVDEKKAAATETTARPINSASKFKTESMLNTSSHWNRQDELGASSPEFINEGSRFSYCPCIKMSETVLHKENIESYKIYEAGVCHMDAIEFKTVNGLTFCANPQNLWVKRAMQFVDEKKAAATETTGRPINSASKFKTESTLITTSHWNGQDETTTSPELAEFAYMCL